MNWLQRIVLAAPNLRIEYFTNNRGQECVGVAGNTFPIKDKLAALGFRWLGGPIWHMPKTQFNPQIEQAVNNLIGTAMQPALQRPVAPLQQQNAQIDLSNRGLDIEEFVNVEGEPCIKVIGNSFQYKDQLGARGLGFRFDSPDVGGQKIWWMQKSDPRADNAIKSIKGGNWLNKLVQNQPVPEKPEKINPPTPAVPQREWKLSKKRTDGLYAAISQFNDKDSMSVLFDWEDIDLNTGTLTQEQIKTAIEIVPDGFTVANQKIITKANNPDVILDPLKKLRDEEERQQEGPIKPDPYQQKVIDTFQQSQQHIMMNALAGTGKTSTLVELAKLKPPGEKWHYIVFNTKNKVEGTEKFKPYGVQVSTSHGFLGSVMKNSNLQEISNTKPWSPDNKKQFGSHTRMALILDQIMYGDKKYTGPDKRDRLWNAKTLVKQTAALAKQFALNPASPDITQKLDALIKQYSLDTRLPTEEETLQEGRGAQLNLRDFKPEIIQDTRKILEACLPGVAESLVPNLTTQRNQQRAALEQKYDQAKWGNDWERKQIPRLKAQLIKLDKSMQSVKSLKDMGQYRDHDDTLWYSALQQYQNQMLWPKYDVVLFDEVQDFNECQKLMMAMLAKQGARIVCAGDIFQCHPAGTMISLTGGKQKPIEEVVAGDEVVVYNTKKVCYPGINIKGRKIREIASRQFNGNLIKIETEHYSHRCTPNHKCLVRFDGKNKYCLYLMRKGSVSRIGIAKLNYTGGFGPTSRAAQEKADDLWVLNIFNTEYEARIAEVITSAKYGLPQLIFHNNMQKYPTQDFIDAVYNGIGDNLETAKLCLQSFGRDFDYPLWTRKEQERFGTVKQNYITSTKSFITQACNLISNVMKVRTFDGTSRGGDWETIQISRELSSCMVYSLEVEPTEGGKQLYIANNIVTHNSIYRFRGSDSQSFQRIQSMLQGLDRGAAVLPIPENHRCGSVIVDYINNNCEPMQKLPPEQRLKADKSHTQKARKRGQVIENMDYNHAMEDLAEEWDKRGGSLKQETAFIARTNAPLAQAAMQLLKKGIDFEILGRDDLSGELTKHLRTALTHDRPVYDQSPPPNLTLERLPDALDAYQNTIESHYQGQVARTEEVKESKQFTEMLKGMIDHLRANRGIDPKHINRHTQQPIVVRDTEGFRNYLQSRFTGLDVENSEADIINYAQRDKRKFITLTTAHRSKGMEYNRVYVIGPELFPSPKAKTQDELTQEFNAEYICYSRGQRNLILVPLPEEEDNENPNGRQMIAG